MHLSVSKITLLGIVVDNSTMVMLKPSKYATISSRGADQLRRWDFYKLAVQAVGMRQIHQVTKRQLSIAGKESVRSSHIRTCLRLIA